jgi:hypothetical protein
MGSYHQKNDDLSYEHSSFDTEGLIFVRPKSLVNVGPEIRGASKAMISHTGVDEKSGQVRRMAAIETELHFRVISGLPVIQTGT